jgi:poly(A) polymerase
LADRLGGHFVSLHEAFDAVRVVAPAEGRAFYIDLTSFESSIEADLARRDFTIDAMAVSLHDALDGNWKLIDPHGGRVDAQDRLVRALDSDVFRADPARMMRAVRLAASLKFSLDTDTAAQIRRDARMVLSVSPERVREELLKTLAEEGAGDSVRLLDELGLLSCVIPELDDARGVAQPKEHHWDVFDHMVESVGYVEELLGQGAADEVVTRLLPKFEGMEEHFSEEITDGHTRRTLVKLTALLHDIAKPATKTTEPSGRIRFFGHADEGARTAGALLRRLRFGRRGVRLVTTMIRHHLRPMQMAQDGALPTTRAVLRYFRDLDDAALDTLYLNVGDFLAARGPELTEEEMVEHCRVIAHILDTGLQSDRPARPIQRLIDGNDIMAEFDLEPGPFVGELLSAVAEAEATGRLSTREEALDLARALVRSGGVRA